MSPHATILAIIVIGCCLVSVGSAGCDACSAAPEGGWGAPDYSDDPTWGASLDDLIDYFGGSPADSGTGGGDAGSSQDSSGSSSPGTDGSSSGSGSTSSAGGGSAEDGLLWRLKGDALSDKGLYNESAEAYRKALIYDPYALKSWTGLGRVSLELGQPEEAAAAFRKAINLDPADAALHEHLGDSLVAGDNFEEAIASYQKALAIHPKIPGVMEKMLAAKDALEGIPEKPDEPVLLEPGPAQAGPPQPAEPPETMTGETLSTQASLQGMVAVIAILFGSVLVVVRRK